MTDLFGKSVNCFKNIDKQYKYVGRCISKKSFQKKKNMYNKKKTLFKS